MSKAMPCRAILNRILIVAALTVVAAVFIAL